MTKKLLGDISSKVDKLPSRRVSPTGGLYIRKDKVLEILLKECGKIKDEEEKHPVELTVGSSSLNKVLEDIQEHYCVEPESIDYKRIGDIEQSTIKFKAVPPTIIIEHSVKDKTPLVFTGDITSWEELSNAISEQPRLLKTISEIQVTEHSYDSLKDEEATLETSEGMYYSGVPVVLFELEDKTPCPKCGGRGDFPDKRFIKCDECNGTGKKK